MRGHRKVAALGAMWGLLVLPWGGGLDSHAQSAVPALLEPGDPGIPNFHRVDEHLFRGGQPSAADLAALQALGVRTVVNLRYEDSLVKAEQAQAEALGMRYVNVPMYGLARPREEQVASVMRILDDPSNWPVFVHCKRGADRTGAIVACYRIAHHGWTPDAAIREADALGMMRLELAKKAYIRDYPSTHPGAEPATVVAAEAGP